MAFDQVVDKAESTNPIDGLTSQRTGVLIYPDFVSETSDGNSGAVLSRLVYWHSPPTDAQKGHRGGNVTNGHWTYRVSLAAFADELGLSKQKVRRGLVKLEGSGLIHRELRPGEPTRLSFSQRMFHGLAKLGKRRVFVCQGIVRLTHHYNQPLVLAQVLFMTYDYQGTSRARQVCDDGGDRWFVRSYRRLGNDLGLMRYQVRRAVDHLVRRRLLIREPVSASGENRFRVDTEVFAIEWQHAEDAWAIGRRQP